MDSFITAHLSADGAANGPVTMGYFTRSELAFYYALADAFTVCDSYFCSVLGPTDPNRLMAMSASIDPQRRARRPGDRRPRPTGVAMTGKLNWETMPEALLKRRGELEGLQRPHRHPRARPAALLQGLHQPALAHRTSS